MEGTYDCGAFEKKNYPKKYETYGLWNCMLFLKDQCFSYFMWESCIKNEKETSKCHASSPVTQICLYRMNTLALRNEGERCISPFHFTTDWSWTGSRMVIRNAAGLSAIHKYGPAHKRKLSFVGPSEGVWGHSWMRKETKRWIYNRDNINIPQTSIIFKNILTCWGD